jgi:hypothetical protein
MEMEEKEREIIRTVREAVERAVRKGEDLEKKAFEVTRDAVKKKKALEGAEVTGDHVESVAKIL